MAQSIYKSLSDRLTHYEVAFRFLGTLIIAYSVNILSPALQTAAIAGLFFIHGVYWLLDLQKFGMSLYNRWLSSDRKIRQGVIETPYLTFQLAISSLFCYSFFSMLLLKFGVLSSSVTQHVQSLYSFIINDVVRSGALLGNIWFRETIKEEHLDHYCDPVSDPRTSRWIAFCLSGLSLIMQHPVCLSVCSAPYVLLSAFYCLEIVSRWTGNHLSKQATSAVVTTHNDEADESANLASAASFGSHLLSLTAWVRVLRLTFSATLLSLPKAYAHIVLSQVPSLLIVPAVTSRAFMQEAVIASMAEQIRTFITDESESTPVKSV